LPASLLSPPPFPCQFSLYPLFVARLCLGSRLWFRDAPRFLDRFFHLSRAAKAGASQVTRQPQLLRKILLLDNSGRQLRHLVGDGSFLSFFNRTGSLSSRSFTLRPLPLRNKQPDRPHQMLGGDIDIPFSENLRDPVNA
jgi:hypothetical protein